MNLELYYDTKNLTKLVKKYPRLTYDQEIDLSKTIQNSENSKDAINRLFLSNILLVVKLAKKFSKQDNIADLIQEGMIGLLNACHKYDYKKQVRFSTYATYWIRQSIIRFLQNKSRSIRLPANVSTQIRHIKAYLNNKLLIGETPTIKEISETLNLTEKMVKNALRSINLEPTNIDSTVKVGSVDDIMQDLKYEIDDTVINNLLKQDIKKIFEKVLTYNEFYVLSSRFGVNNIKHKTLEDLSNELKICRETVRQLEISAINKIKESKYSKKLAQYLL